MAAPRPTGRSRLSCLVTGNLQTNCYLISPENGSLDCALVDPGGSAPDIVAAVLSTASGQLGSIFLTHGHADHWAALPDLLTRWPEARVLSSATAGQWLADPEANLSGYIGETLQVAPRELHSINPDEVIDLAGLECMVLATPGHTPGCLSLYAQASDGPVLLCGDVLFAGSVGRTDLPGGSWNQLAASLRRLITLPSDTLVLPGHGPSTTVGAEAARNPYVRQAMEDRK